ncbi:hypothetical protein FGIG_12216 [Fasciola gigantica]|uniref:Integrator complex subunit 4 n=1 Tax=Fasciola gigantica TaxID=46835 RepID=A0A504WV17_FASGI|nr:hypothetical protein FGIG_12216 [Fasciola gigantica]
MVWLHSRPCSEESLILTLEKTVMSDRQVPTFGSGTIHRTNRASRHDRRRVKISDPQLDRARTVSSLGTFNLIATGSSGAIISGLEDDYFEVRCATLSTVTHMASLSAQFAANCQDLLVDILTDDIQEVRLAAIRALGAVGDQVRIHAVLLFTVSSVQPSLSNQELLHSYSRCAASVGRRHSVFVETCLSSLLRTHLWLSGPEPNWEDPAYLTVLLLVLNAEPGAPGMHAQFPRHLAATKVCVPFQLKVSRHFAVTIKV